jgi:hypothetical protein
MKTLRRLNLALLVLLTNTSLASAQSYLSPGYIMGELRDALGFVRQEPAPDFVVKARPDPASLSYKPLTLPPANFHHESSSAASRLAAEAPAIAELESARARNQSQAAGGGRQKSQPAPVASPLPEDPAQMKWNPWETD